MADTHDKATISVTSAHKSSPIYTPPKQSANTLFHFMKKIDYLIPLIEKEALIPRYCVETVDYLNIEMNKIAYPMLCFCDINLHKIDEHMSFYGGYGIAFSKEWGIENGIQPIQYINPNSILHNDFSTAFADAMKDSTTDSAQNFLLSQMYYFKAIEGDMLRDGKNEHKNFTDECEWRFIPNVDLFGLPQAVAESEIYSITMLNNAILVEDDCWLKFDINDIKYIIIQNNDDFNSMIRIIDSKADIDDNIKRRLISKIILWSDTRGDF